VCVIQVLVSDVAGNEDMIYVYLQHSNRQVELEQLLDRLDDVYSSTDDTADNAATYRRGDAVAVYVATVWQRATVLRDTVGDDEAIGVRCVDCGSVHEVDGSKVRWLHADLLTEPMFGFECELFGVTADAGMMTFQSVVIYTFCYKIVLVTTANNVEVM